MPRVYSYERVSSFRQAKGGRGLERQAGSADRWCAERGLELDQALTLVDPGRSAFHGDNVKEGAALGEFLRLAQAGELGEAPILLVEAIDRLSRLELVDALQDVIFGLLRAGVTIETLEDGKSYTASAINTDIGTAIQLIAKVHGAADYSKRLSRRITASWDQAYAELEAGRLPRKAVFVPSWCTRDGDQIHLIPEKVAIVHRIFDLALEDGLTVITRKLNAERVPTLNGRPSWTQSAVKLLLHDIRLTGAIRINDQKRHSERTRLRRGERARNERVFPDLLPIVITPERWERTHAAIGARFSPNERRGRQTELHFIAQGLARCICGSGVGTTSTMSGRKAGSRKLIRYVKCRHNADHADGCRGLGYRLNDLNRNILTRLHQGQLQQLLAQGDSARAAQIRAEGAAIERLEAQLVAAEQAETNAAKLFKAALKEGRDDPLYRESVEEARLEVELAKTALTGARQRLAGLRHDIDSAEFDAAVRELFMAFVDGQDTPKQRQQLNRLLRRSGIQITLDNEQQRVGMAIGEGPIDWQLIGSVDVAALRHGLVGGVPVEFTPTEKNYAVLKTLEDEHGVIDLTPVFKAFFGPDAGAAVAVDSTPGKKKGAS